VYLAIILGSFLSAFGILQYLDLFGHSWWIPQEFLSATFVNHNHFAGLLELIIPVTVAAFLGIVYGRHRTARISRRRTVTRSAG
jgi:hypothetical protein